MVEREQPSQKRFHRHLVVKGLVARKKVGATRTSVPPYSYNSTMQGRAIIRQMDDVSVTHVRKGLGFLPPIRQWPSSPSDRFMEVRTDIGLPRQSRQNSKMEFNTV